jgi:hypothetical protein
MKGAATAQEMSKGEIFQLKFDFDVGERKRIGKSHPQIGNA